MGAEIEAVADQDKLKQRWRKNGKVSIRDILACAGEEGSYARTLLKQRARDLGLAIANLVNFYNPEAVFIGGRVAEAGECFIDIIRDTVQTHTFPEVAQAAEIHISRLGGDSGAIGGCALVLKELLESSDSQLLHPKTIPTGIVGPS
ncbi:MAG: ROK family protein [Negativicutes bacterium]|nr:ROK family protein [Negativicutes bacterium]